jgi:hypothetical protein
MEHQRNLLSALLLLLFANSMGAADLIPSRVNYIERYKDLAIAEMERSGVLASIKLAQGILETNDGTSQLATYANNHFGIKCKNDWTGETFFVEDDDYDSEGKLMKSCFRAYGSDFESYINHTEFLLKNPRYQVLFSYGTDYKKWAYGLKESGYATNPVYAEKLIKVIEEYRLYEYDRQAIRPERYVGTRIEEMPQTSEEERVSTEHQARKHTDDWFAAAPATATPSDNTGLPEKLHNSDETFSTVMPDQLATADDIQIPVSTFKAAVKKPVTRNILRR